MKNQGNSRFRRIFALTLALMLALSSFGVTAAFAEGEAKIIPDYESYEETLRAGEALNFEIMSEGAVLMKNDNGALPLKGTERSVTVFGLKSIHPVLGGSGSGGGHVTDKMEYVDLYDGLEQAGFKTNKVVKQFYEAQPYEEDNPYSGVATVPEIDPALLEDYVDSYKAYGDAAIVVFGRTGGEMSDRPRQDIEGDHETHYLELVPKEKALLEHVEKYFDKVIVLINSSNAMELGVLEDDDAIDSVLWIGGPGINGLAAVAKIISGEVNPSGRLSDVYMADFKQDPTWFNSGNLSQFFEGEGMYSNELAAMYAKGSETAWDPAEEAGEYGIYTVLEYNEGIYMGYRWYETAAAEGFFDGETPAKAPGGTGVVDTYYNRNTGVVYPFGFGMSYTTFAYSGYQVTVPADKDGNVVIDVDVTNTGSVAGKEVVQVYSHSPYLNGGIEKADVDLVDFTKTKLLQPGETEHITLEFPLRDIAQFDYNDANGNGAKTYEIDAAPDYAISLRSDSHTVKDGCSFTFSIGETYVYDTDEFSGNAIEAVFSQGDIYDSMIGKSYEEVGGVTRADGKFGLPRNATVEDRSFDEKYLKEMDDNIYYEPYEDEETDAYYRASVPASWTQNPAGGTTDIYTMQGKSYTAPVYDAATATWTESDDPDTLAWEEYLNQMSFEQLVTLVSYGSYGHRGLEAINLPLINANDGPGQLRGGGNGSDSGEYGTYYASHVVIASTWNLELAEREGQIIGNESLFLGTVGWYGPGANVHRSPFGGRNFEYYSQDGVHGGKFAAAVVTGVMRKGVAVFIKHLGANEQEHLRSEPNNATVITEQALRQIYLKCFEYAFKAGCNGSMTCTTRIGINPSANNHAFLTKLIRGEWGRYEILFIEDVENETWHEMNLNLRGGNSLPLADYTGQVSGIWDDANKTVTVDAGPGDTTQVASTTQWYWVRSAAQHVLQAAVNSNLMKNHVDLGAFVDATLPGAYTGVDYTASIGIPAEGVNVTKYNVKGGKLPAGLALGSDGIISGTPAEAGTFDFTVEMSCENWIKKTANYSLTVDYSIKMEGEPAFTVGQDGEVQLSCVLDPAIYNEIIYSVSGGALPAGLQINQQGLIYGTPTEAGDFAFTAKVTATREDNSMTTAQIVEDTITRDFVLSVAPAGEEEAAAPAAAAPAAEAPAAEAPAAETPAAAAEAPAAAAAAPVKSAGGVAGVVLGSIAAVLSVVSLAVTLIKKKK